MTSKYLPSPVYTLRIILGLVTDREEKMVNGLYSQSIYGLTKQYRWEKGWVPHEMPQNVALGGINQREESASWTRREDLMGSVGLRRGREEFAKHKTIGGIPGNKKVNSWQETSGKIPFSWAQKMSLCNQRIFVHQTFINSSGSLYVLDIKLPGVTRLYVRSLNLDTSA